jgi:His/Glu/Gln/Arg/opine family amino acid ABC transporter permease subunit
MLHGYGPAILGGLWVTLSAAGLSLAVACLFGLAGAAAKLSGARGLRWLAEAYTTVIRGLPDLVLMLLIFYGGQIALNALAQRQGWDYIDVPPFAAGVLTLGFIYGAYLTETFRGAILAVPAGQTEAALAYGMRRWQVWRRIMLPQMVRHAIPGFANNWLVMVKATALVSIIGLDDMVHRANLPFTFFMLIAVIYLSITTLSLAALAWLERRYSLGVRKVSF